ncbi:unnamed protein product [Caenorhabditis auriculariae]|uniref:Uncharacterized protein n=1 Tax=Caenorhabditis auriculariae TaxID=2777116 RepID=A0A8S1GVK2_9PELO|nr:unnamed protein product [Caenorhabditis auriculariae]
MAENLLDNYNPLYDIHLRQYFALPHMQKHLQKMGLLESSLNLNGDEVYARHHAMMDMMLKNREAQLMKMAELRKKLDAAEKVEICRRIRSGQSPESYRRGKPSRSLSRGRGAQKGGRQRRFSNSFEDKDFVVKIEKDNAEPVDYNTKDPYSRLSANAKRFNYLHKLDDPTLIAYKDNLKKQLQRLERFREISFGPHSVARQPAPSHTSWFFRRRSLPSLTASAPGHTLRDPLRSILNMRGRKTSPHTGAKLNASHDSRTSCPPTTRKRRESNPRLPPISGNKAKTPAKTPNSNNAAMRLPPAYKKPSPSRGRPVTKRTTASTTANSEIKSPLPSVTGTAIVAGAAAAAAAATAVAASVLTDDAEKPSSPQPSSPPAKIASPVASPTPAEDEIPSLENEQEETAHEPQEAYEQDYKEPSPRESPTDEYRHDVPSEPLSPEPTLDNRKATPAASPVALSEASDLETDMQTNVEISSEYHHHEEQRSPVSDVGSERSQHAQAVDYHADDEQHVRPPSHHSEDFEKRSTISDFHKPPAEAKRHEDDEIMERTIVSSNLGQAPAHSDSDDSEPEYAEEDKEVTNEDQGISSKDVVASEDELHISNTASHNDEVSQKSPSSEDESKITLLEHSPSQDGNPAVTIEQYDVKNPIEEPEQAEEQDHHKQETQDSSIAAEEKIHESEQESNETDSHSHHDESEHDVDHLGDIAYKEHVHQLHDELGHVPDNLPADVIQEEMQEHKSPEHYAPHDEENIEISHLTEEENHHSVHAEDHHEEIHNVPHEDEKSPAASPVNDSYDQNSAQFDNHHEEEHDSSEKADVHTFSSEPEGRAQDAHDFEKDAENTYEQEEREQHISEPEKSEELHNVENIEEKQSELTNDFSHEPVHEEDTHPRPETPESQVKIHVTHEENYERSDDLESEPEKQVEHEEITVEPENERQVYQDHEEAPVSEEDLSQDKNPEEADTVEKEHHVPENSETFEEKPLNEPKLYAGYVQQDQENEPAHEFLNENGTHSPTEHLEHEERYQESDHGSQQADNLHLSNEKLQDSVEKDHEFNHEHETLDRNSPTAFETRYGAENSSPTEEKIDHIHYEEEEQSQKHTSPVQDRFEGSPMSFSTNQEEDTQSDRFSHHHDDQQNENGSTDSLIIHDDVSVQEHADLMTKSIYEERDDKSETASQILHDQIEALQSEIPVTTEEREWDNDGKHIHETVTYGEKTEDGTVTQFKHTETTVTYGNGIEDKTNNNDDDDDKDLSLKHDNAPVTPNGNVAHEDYTPQAHPVASNIPSGVIVDDHDEENISNL